MENSSLRSIHSGLSARSARSGPWTVVFLCGFLCPARAWGRARRIDACTWGAKVTKSARERRSYLGDQSFVHVIWQRRECLALLQGMGPKALWGGLDAHPPDAGNVETKGRERALEVERRKHVLCPA